MLKFKFCLILTVSVIAVLGAFADRSKALCELQQQYVKIGSTYMPVGEYGVDYVCYTAAGTCTYYLANPFNPNSYAPCRTGAFSWLYK